MGRSAAPVAKPPNASAADEAAHQKAVRANTFGKSGEFKSDDEARKAAVSDFRQKYGQQYPSTFKEKPATRPEYIPETTTVNGQKRQVEYRTEGGTGGYYYYDDVLRRWVLRRWGRWIRSRRGSWAACAAFERRKGDFARPGSERASCREQ